MPEYEPIAKMTDRDGDEIEVSQARPSGAFEELEAATVNAWGNKRFYVEGAGKTASFETREEAIAEAARRASQ